ncbi:hypothetical protein BJX63DRAFT_392213 [Aspergillus granulosus]|uniref:Uncharacterized protein n=1 Tax=Aspergillus granulosus TaxID=176169 RepID=A0ABR4HG01_9EURO
MASKRLLARFIQFFPCICSGDLPQVIVFSRSGGPGTFGTQDQAPKSPGPLQYPQSPGSFIPDQVVKSQDPESKSMPQLTEHTRIKDQWPISPLHNSPKRVPGPQQPPLDSTDSKSVSTLGSEAVPTSNSNLRIAPVGPVPSNPCPGNQRPVSDHNPPLHNSLKQSECDHTNDEGATDSNFRIAPVDPEARDLCPGNQRPESGGSILTLPTIKEMNHYLNLPNETYQDIVDDGSGMLGPVDAAEQRYTRYLVGSTMDSLSLSSISCQLMSRRAGESRDGSAGGSTELKASFKGRVGKSDIESSPEARDVRESGVFGLHHDSRTDSSNGRGWDGSRTG